jgi:hypothetical protein
LGKEAGSRKPEARKENNQAEIRDRILEVREDCGFDIWLLESGL